MRKISLSIAVIAGIAASYGLGRYHSQTQQDGKARRHAMYYVDPMHPAYRSDRPGIAPDCGMQLEPVFAETAGTASTTVQIAQTSAGAVNIDDATQRLMGLRLAPVERSGTSRMVRVVGRVTPEDTRIFRVNPGVDGFVRETYSDSVGVLVKKDQKLATYYSPEFLSPASGFLAAIERVPGSAGKDGAKSIPFPGAVAKQGVSSIQGYTDRLRNLGMSDVQIQQVADSRQLPENIDVVAPADGFILSRSITPGQHFERNMEFYRIADLSRVWVIAEVSEQEAPSLRPGGQALVTLRDEGRRWTARVTDSLPQSEPGGGTVKLRLELDNPNFVLRPDMLVDVELPVRLAPAVTVPADALVDSGARTRVYVAHGEGVFEPREVETGWRSSERVEILHGVEPGERVVVAATFLVDSESRLKSAAPAPPLTRIADKPGTAHATMTMATGMVKDPSCGMPVDSAKATASGNTLAANGTVYYFCSKQCKQTFQNDQGALASRRKGDDDD